MNDEDVISGTPKTDAANAPDRSAAQLVNKQPGDITLQKEAVMQERYENLQELEVNPPPYAFYFIKNIVDHSLTLAFLQDIETTPPFPAFDTILDKVKMK